MSVDCSGEMCHFQNRLFILLYKIMCNGRLVLSNQLKKIFYFCNISQVRAQPASDIAHPALTDHYEVDLLAGFT